MLDIDGNRNVRKYKTNKSFRFGDGKSVRAHKKVNIPDYIGNEKLSIETEVVESDITLLISKTFMKKMGMVVNLAEDMIEWKLGRVKNLKSTSTSHYAVPITKCESFGEDRNFMRYILYSYGKSDVKRKVAKLHKQFA